MEITVEISYYGLTNDYNTPVKEFLDAITGNKSVTIEPGMMSTMITGEYDLVMRLLTKTISPLMEKYPSVFVLKIANACHSCKTTG
jgi:uncharacterized protein YqgV (UPF0045/DUF77 family)